jgi:hypothetical protein
MTNYSPCSVSGKRSRHRWGISNGEGVVVTNLRYGQAKRRAAGLNRKEMDLEGKAIKHNPEDRKRRLANKKKRKQQS